MLIKEKELNRTRTYGSLVASSETLRAISTSIQHVVHFFLSLDGVPLLAAKSLQTVAAGMSAEVDHILHQVQI